MFAVAKVGDEEAWAAIDIMCDYLGRALSIIANVVDPEAFVLGGGTSNSAVLFLDRLEASYRRYALPVTSEAPIELASLGNGRYLRLLWCGVRGAPGGGRRGVKRGAQAC